MVCRPGNITDQDPSRCHETEEINGRELLPRSVRGLRQSPDTAPTYPDLDGDPVVIDPKTINEARRALGLRLAAYRQAAGHGQRELAPLVHYSRSSLANVETGRQKASLSFWQQCDEVLNTGGALAIAFEQIEAQERQRRHEVARRPTRQPAFDTSGGGQDDIRNRVALAAHASQSFVTQWESRCLAPQMAEEFAEDLSRLASEYVHQPLDGIFDELVAVRDRACGLLGEQRLVRDTRGLLFVAGLACGLLAHASIDLGDRRSAARQARVASRLATEAGHNALLAWIFGTQSLIAYCLGHPDQAVEFARRGEAYGASGTGRVRLGALKARGYAAQRNGPAARQTITEIQVARDEVRDLNDLDSMGGVLTFPPAKEHYYAASTAVLMSDGVAAEAAAEQAIMAYENGPEAQRSYGDLALARVYLAQARLLKPVARQDPAAAGDALQAVFTLPPAQRIAGLHRPLRRTQAQLDREPVRHSSEARELHARIDGFLRDTPAITST
jgi:DNA-binding XRE family transcriptional regulator